MAKYLDSNGLGYFMSKLKNRLMPSGGSAGQVLAKASGTDYDAEWVTAQGGVTVDTALSSTSENPVQNKVIKTALDGKQGSLTFDSAPADGSSNPVTSDGIYTALDDKADASHSHAAGDITSGTLAKARGGTGTNGSSVAANRVLASPNGSTGAISFRALVAADLPDITFNALSDAAITERAAHYSTSINNTTSEYTSAGATGWTYIKIANTVIAWGFISASVAISTAFGSIYISSADRYFRLPVAMTNIVSCIFGSAFGGSQNSGVSAVLRGNNADYLPTSGSLYCLPFRFTCTASVSTAATSRVPVMLVGRAA